MKKISFFVILCFITTTAFAQLSNYSIGIIGTHFHNQSKDNRISKELDNPYGYGVIVARNINEKFSVALSAEYYNDNIKKIDATETAYRFHLSGAFHTLETEYIEPYFAAGLVFTNRIVEYKKDNISDETDNLLNGRLSVGMNIPVYANLFVNGDLAMYTDGFNYVGWATTIGFRVGL